MKPPAFDYARPTSVPEALAILSKGGSGARILAGGQSLVPMMNFRAVSPELIIDINRLNVLDYHRVEDGHLVIGALSRHAALRDSAVVRAASPLMWEAYKNVAHGPIRNRGTLCGNLCHADPASEMPAVMLATNAVMVLKDKNGERRVPARDFFKGVYETAAKADEMLVEVRIPVAPKKQGWAFLEISIRKGDFAIAGVGATISVGGGKVSGVSIAVCGVGNRALRLPTLESALVGKATNDQTWAQAATDAAAAIDPQSDVNANGEYRRDVVRALVARVLSTAASRAQ